MSLLTSGQLTHNHQKFYRKMQHQFQRRSFYNCNRLDQIENYKNSPHVLKEVNEKTQKMQELLSQMMASFIQQLKKLIAGATNSRVDYFYVLSKMKNENFFSEVIMIQSQIAQIINEDSALKIRKLTKQIDQMKIREKQERQKFRERINKTPVAPDKSSAFNGIKSLAENLYAKAKILSEDDFVLLCDQSFLGQKLLITKMENIDLHEKDEKEERNLLRRIDLFIESRRKYSLEGIDSQFLELVDFLRQYRDIKKQQIRCKQPCCQVREEVSIIKSGMSKSARGVVRPIYKNDKSQEYFNRYYRRSEFEIGSISSVQRTRLEEMERLEDDYRVHLKGRKKGLSVSNRYG